MPVDNLVDNPVDKLWISCGQIVDKCELQSYPHVIHRISTGYPQSYPQLNSMANQVVK